MRGRPLFIFLAALASALLLIGPAVDSSEFWKFSPAVWDFVWSCKRLNLTLAMDWVLRVLLWMPSAMLVFFMFFVLRGSRMAKILFPLAIVSAALAFFVLLQREINIGGLLFLEGLSLSILLYLNALKGSAKELFELPNQDDPVR
jgi:hypothetical protein